jgi:DNA-binding MarR family transcriptional regulator
MQIETFFPYQLAVTAEAFSRQLTEVYGREHGLSREEWRLLFLLNEAGGLDSLRISQRTSLDKVQVSRAATRLEAKRLITRRVSEVDRRLRDYAVTSAGRDLFEQAFVGVERRADQILQELSRADREALVRGIAALGRAISAVSASDETPSAER